MNINAETFFLSIGLLATSKNTFNCKFQPRASRLGTVVSAVILGDCDVTGGDGNVRFSIDLELFLTSLYGENRHLRKTGPSNIIPESSTALLCLLESSNSSFIPMFCVG